MVANRLALSHQPIAISMDSAVIEVASPLVSIIMPAYNASRFIAESIDSVLAQTYIHWELVIVDDGSTDNTAEIIKSYCHQDSRVRYLYQENARQSRARNNGILHSAGEYIAFLDADDLWLPHKLAVQLQVLLSKEIDLTFSDAYIFEKYFDETSTMLVLNSGKGIYKGVDALPIFLKQNQVPILTVLVKREALTRVNNFSENKEFINVEDYHLWLKMLLAGCVFLGSSEVLAAYRVHATAVSSADRAYVKYIVEAKANLLQNHPEQQGLLQDNLKKNVRDNLSQISEWDDKEFYSTIVRNLEIIQKGKYKLIFSFLRMFKMRHIALKFGYFVVNYL
jgi:teichuronic acid biosynthesis glycosyltransferase TuaG